LSNENHEEYIAYTLCQIPRQKAEMDIENFAKTISERYSNSQGIHESLYSALVDYTGKLALLRENPLHQAVAYYDTSQGRVSLYEYLSSQVNILANSITFDPIPTVIIQKTDTISFTIRAASSKIEHIGPVNRWVTIYGMNNQAPPVHYIFTGDNSFTLNIFTNRLVPGRYNVLFDPLIPGMSLNASGGFSFELTRITAELVFSGDPLGEKEQTKMRDGVNNALTVGGIPVILSAHPPETWPEQSRSAFVITINSSTIPSGEFTKEERIRGTVSLGFTRNGFDLLPPASVTITERDIPWIIQNAANDIKNNAVFFQHLKEQINR
jgi:hypothetical protein